MIIETYKHFHKEIEVFGGLSLRAIVELGILVIGLVLCALKLKLALNSPLLIVLSLFATTIAAFIIKRSRSNEEAGFYSSFLTYPLHNHLYFAKTNSDGYNSMEDELGITKIQDDYFINKDNSHYAVFKLNQALALNRLNTADAKHFIQAWKHFLIEFKSINKPDTLSINIQGNKLSFISKSQGRWINQKWEPQIEFYIILEQLNSHYSSIPWYKIPIIKSLFPYKPSLSEQEEEQANLSFKVREIIKRFEMLNLKLELLTGDKLNKFLQDYTSYDYASSGIIMEDSNQYIKHQNTYSKTLELLQLPDSGELDFWLKDFYRYFQTDFILSLQLNHRDASEDRRRAESRSKIIQELSRKVFASSQILIQENNKIAQKLLENPYSFDLSLSLTLIADSPEKLSQELANISRASKTALWANMDRRQCQAFLASFPFSSHNPIRHFVNLDLAAASFPFLRNALGTSQGFLWAYDIEDRSTIYLDEYNSNEFNNRGFNFIGDSGSGKTVAAKLAIKRRLEDPSRSFYILDNTEDGWQFFIDYHGGNIVEIDKFTELKSQESLFTPLFLPQDLSNFNLESHLDRCINLLSLFDNYSGISIAEKQFLNLSLRELYSQKSQPKFSDLYYLWKNNSFSQDSLTINKWLNLIAPYCHQAQGIYAKLLDGEKAILDNQKRLILFTFSKLERDQSYLTIALSLIANFLTQKIIFDKQSHTTFVVDEAWKIFQNKSNDKGKEILTHFARAGRGLDLGLWTISQKPNDLPREVHSSASCTVAFQLKESNDRAELAAAASLSDNEKLLLSNPLIYNSGTALMKTTRASGLINFDLSPEEFWVCNSTRALVNQRKAIFSEIISSAQNITPALRQEAAKETINILIKNAKTQQ